MENSSFKQGYTHPRRSQVILRVREGAFSTFAGAEIPDNYLSGLPKSLGFDATAHGSGLPLRSGAAKGVFQTNSELSLQPEMRREAAPHMPGISC